MKGLALVALLAWASCGAHAAALHDKASAIEAAKRYMKARCTAQVPCRFRPERDGPRWRVWVHASRPRATFVLYFDAEGNLTRRLEVD